MLQEKSQIRVFVIFCQNNVSLHKKTWKKAFCELKLSEFFATETFLRKKIDEFSESFLTFRVELKAVSDFYGTPSGIFGTVNLMKIFIIVSFCFFEP